MGRENELLRDLARLFMKYETSDWQTVLRLLETVGGQHDAILRAAGVARGSAKTESKPRSQRAAPVEPFPDGIDPGRADLLRRLYGGLKERSILPTAASMRETYIRAGGKEKFPSRRDEAIRVLLHQLATLPEQDIASALHGAGDLKGDLKGEYSRWFDLIYKRGPDGS